MGGFFLVVELAGGGSVNKVASRFNNAILLVDRQFTSIYKIFTRVFTWCSLVFLPEYLNGFADFYCCLHSANGGSWFDNPGT